MPTDVRFGRSADSQVLSATVALDVAAPDWQPRQGWEETLKRSTASFANEDEETLAHWASLPEATECGQAETESLPEAVLHEEPKPYGDRQGQGGA